VLLPAPTYQELYDSSARERSKGKGFVLTLYRMVMPIGTPFLKEKINN